MHTYPILRRQLLYWIWDFFGKEKRSITNTHIKLRRSKPTFFKFWFFLTLVWKAMNKMFSIYYQQYIHFTYTQYPHSTVYVFNCTYTPIVHTIYNICMYTIVDFIQKILSAMHTSFPQLVKPGSRFLANNSKHFGSFGRYSLNISVERIVNIQYNSYAMTIPKFT